MLMEHHPAARTNPAIHVRRPQLDINDLIGGLRLAKGALMWSEYRQKAGEAGRK